MSTSTVFLDLETDANAAIVHYPFGYAEFHGARFGRERYAQMFLALVADDKGASTGEAPTETETPICDANELIVNGVRTGWVKASVARQLEMDMMDQARLNGMGSEREASMLATIELLQRENARLQMELDGTCNAEELRQVREENARLKQATYEAMHAIDELGRRKETKP